MGRTTTSPPKGLPHYTVDTSTQCGPDKINPYAFYKRKSSTIPDTPKKRFNLFKWLLSKL